MTASGNRSDRQPVHVPEGGSIRGKRTFLEHDAGSRTYKVYVPSGYTRSVPPGRWSCTARLHSEPRRLRCWHTDERCVPRSRRSWSPIRVNLQAPANMQKNAGTGFPTPETSAGARRGEPSLIAGIAMHGSLRNSPLIQHVSMWRVLLSWRVQRRRSPWRPLHPERYFCGRRRPFRGWPAAAARDMPTAFAAMAREAGAIRPRGEGRTVPTGIVFHGDADRTVNPVNSDHVIAQASQDAALTKTVTHGETPGGMALYPNGPTRPSRRGGRLDAVGHCTRCGQPCLVGRQRQWLLHGRASGPDASAR